MENQETKRLVATEEVASLFSEAEFVAQCAEEAALHLRNGDPERAAAALRQCERHAGMVQSRRDFALAAVARLSA